MAPARAFGTRCRDVPARLGPVWAMPNLTVDAPVETTSTGALTH